MGVEEVPGGVQSVKGVVERRRHGELLLAGGNGGQGRSAHARGAPCLFYRQLARLGSFEAKQTRPGGGPFGRTGVNGEGRWRWHMTGRRGAHSSGPGRVSRVREASFGGQEANWGRHRAKPEGISVFTPPV